MSNQKIFSGLVYQNDETNESPNEIIPKYYAVVDGFSEEIELKAYSFIEDKSSLKILRDLADYVVCKCQFNLLIRPDRIYMLNVKEQSIKMIENDKTIDIDDAKSKKLTK